MRAATLAAISPEFGAALSRTPPRLCEASSRTVCNCNSSSTRICISPPATATHHQPAARIHHLSTINHRSGDHTTANLQQIQRLCNSTSPRFSHLHVIFSASKINQIHHRNSATFLQPSEPVPATIREYTASQPCTVRVLHAAAMAVPARTSNPPFSHLKPPRINDSAQKEQQRIQQQHFHYSSEQQHSSASCTSPRKRTCTRTP